MTYFTFDSDVESWIGSGDDSLGACTTPTLEWVSSLGHNADGCIKIDLCDIDGYSEGPADGCAMANFVFSQNVQIGDKLSFWYKIQNRKSTAREFRLLHGTTDITWDSEFTYDTVPGSSSTAWKKVTLTATTAYPTVDAVNISGNCEDDSNGYWTLYIDDVGIAEEPPVGGLIQFWQGLNGLAYQSDLPQGMATPDSLAVRNEVATVGYKEAETQQVQSSGSYISWAVPSNLHNTAVSSVNSIKYINPCEELPGEPTGGISLPTEDGSTVDLGPAPGNITNPVIGVDPNTGNPVWLEAAPARAADDIFVFMGA